MAGGKSEVVRVGVGVGLAARKGRLAKNKKKILLHQASKRGEVKMPTNRGLAETRSRGVVLCCVASRWVAVVVVMVVVVVVVVFVVVVLVLVLD